MESIKYFCDFETNKEGVVMYSIVNIDHKVVGLGCVEDFIQWFYKRYSSEHSVSHKLLSEYVVECYFHNLSYDGNYIIKWLVNSGYIQTLNSGTYAHIEKVYLLFMDTNYKIYSLSFYYKGLKFVFKCTYNLFGGSVKSMGEKVGLPKLNVDISKINTSNLEEYKEYCLRDSEIIFKYYELMQAKGHSEFYESSKVMTKGGVAKQEYLKSYRMWKKSYKYSRYIKSIKLDEWYHYKQWYRGGLCVYNDLLKNKDLKNVSSYDINSSYPYAMTQKLPIIKVSNCKHKLPLEKCKFLLIRINSAMIKEDWMPGVIPSNQEWNKTYVKSIVMPKLVYVIDKELYYWEKFYDIEYSIVNSEEWYIDYVNKEFVDKWYKIKLDCKKEGDYFGEQSAKLILNSAYGKLGEKPHRPRIFISGEEYELADILDINGDRFKVIKEKQRHSQGINYYLIQPIDERKKRLTPVYQAAYITCLARCELYKHILNVGERFLYSDTDSIKCFGDFPKESIDNSILGKWKFEGTYDLFKYLKPKCYLGVTIKNDERVYSQRIAGFNGNIEWEQFYYGSVIKNGCKKRSFDEKGNIILVDTDFVIEND